MPNQLTVRFNSTFPAHPLIFLAFIPLMAFFIGTLGLEIAILLLIPSAIILAFATAAVWSRQEMPGVALIIDDAGVSLPCLGDIFLSHKIIDSFWIDRHSSRRGKYTWYTLSIQCKPRVTFGTPIMAWLNGVRTNTLLEGDVRFDEDLIDTDLTEIIAALQEGSIIKRPSALRPV